MYKRNKQIILKTKIKDIIILRNLYKNIILKSIIHNRNLIIKNRLISKFFLNKINWSKNRKKCLFTGKQKNVNAKLNLSRHNINFFSKLGILQNFKIKSW